MRLPLIALSVASVLPVLSFGGNGTNGASRVAGIAGVEALADATIGSARDVASQGRGKDSAAERKLMEAWHGTADPDAIPMAGISFPVAHHDNGSVRIQFKADEALLPSLDSDFIRAKGITIDLFNPAGVMIGTFHGEHGLYDRAARVGFCEGPVLISDKDVRIDGTNMIWDLESRNAKILENARVVVRHGMIKGVGGSFQ